MTTSRRPAKRATTKPATTKRATTKRATTKRATRKRSTTTTTRRKRAGTATTIGAGIGTLIVAAVLGASWAVRIALVVLVALAGLGYLLWSHREAQP